jgi:aspartyl-tRNA(Asn)/glutamyl-tRNA(Gln) amidotransferase subunit A
MAGFDPKDSTSVDRRCPISRPLSNGGVKGLTIGIPREYRMDGMPAEIEKLWQQGIAWLKAAGREIRDISLPHTKYALPAYYIVAPGRGLVEPRALRRRALRPAGDRQGHHRHVRELTRAKGFGARSSGAS